MMEARRSNASVGSEEDVGAYQQRPEEPTIAPVTTALDSDPSTPGNFRDIRVIELLVAISDAIFNRIALFGTGTLKQSGPGDLAPIDKGFMWLRMVPAEVSRLLGPSPAEAELAAAAAMFPAGISALITARIDAHVRVSRSSASLEVAIQQCTEPAFLFQELSEPFDAMHALHLVCDPAKDTGSTFVMIEFNGEKFVPKGWVDGESAARYAAEGAKTAKGRPPDFQGATGKLPK